MSFIEIDILVEDAGLADMGISSDVQYVHGFLRESEIVYFHPDGQGTSIILKDDLVIHTSEESDKLAMRLQ